MIDYKLLVKEAYEAQKMAYVPYSHWKVGAALLTAEGKLYAHKLRRTHGVFQGSKRGRSQLCCHCHRGQRRKHADRTGQLLSAVRCMPPGNAGILRPQLQNNTGKRLRRLPRIHSWRTYAGTQHAAEKVTVLFVGTKNVQNKPLNATVTSV